MQGFGMGAASCGTREFPRKGSIIGLSAVVASLQMDINYIGEPWRHTALTVGFIVSWLGTHGQD